MVRGEPKEVLADITNSTINCIDLGTVRNVWSRALEVSIKNIVTNTWSAFRVRITSSAVYRTRIASQSFFIEEEPIFTFWAIVKSQIFSVIIPIIVSNNNFSNIICVWTSDTIAQIRNTHVVSLVLGEKSLNAFIASSILWALLAILHSALLAHLKSWIPEVAVFTARTVVVFSSFLINCPW